MTALIIPRDSPLYARLTSLAAQRMVFFTGLPGTGKSLLIHQLAHQAAAAGRPVHLLQWDVARPVFEATPAAARYPMVRGVTHPVIRKALGTWARRAVPAWQARHPDPQHLLIGETPLVGHRFIELVRRMEDPAEALLAAPSSRFVIPVPSREVRRHIESEREQRIRRPRHDRERHDAAPQVLRDLWEQIVEVAEALGAVEGRRPPRLPAPFDPALYERVYRRLLVHRHAEYLPLETLLPVSGFTAYAFLHPTHDIVPTPEDAAVFIQAVERDNPDPDRLREEIARWYVV
jgi:hypothetical protein